MLTSSADWFAKEEWLDDGYFLDHKLEIENRIKNLFWTVSGDYSLDMSPDVDTFRFSPALALYDAVKKGGFASHFDTGKLALYILKKISLGAKREELIGLSQLCVDAASFRKSSEDRKGLPEIRRKAMEDLLEMTQEDDKSPVSMIRNALTRRGLGLPAEMDGEVKRSVLEIEGLSEKENTDEIIAVIDGIYNSVIDRDFRYGLDAVLDSRVSAGEFIEADMSMSDEMMQRVLSEYMSVVKDELLRTRSIRRPSVKRQYVPQTTPEEEISEPSPEDIRKIREYMERQFGTSYLTQAESDRLNKKLCTGFHNRCTLHLTRGLQSNPAVKNTRFLRTEMQAMKNEMYFEMKSRPLKKSTQQLGSLLRQIIVRRQDEETNRADTGDIVPARLWRIGRSSEHKLFDKKSKRDDTGFVVDILLDSSSSQNIRQPQIAAQAYVVSGALSIAGIPHRVQSFCSYWDYTMLHLFRDYDDGENCDRNVVGFRTFGENRDGLAIRTVVDSLIERGEENKVLVILSDGKPNNLGSSRPGSRRPSAYVGEAAVNDTALEIRKARNAGIRVLGIFVGDEGDLSADKKIFGKDFVYTRNISSFANAVGRYLTKLLEDD